MHTFIWVTSYQSYERLSWSFLIPEPRKIVWSICEYLPPSELVLVQEQVFCSILLKINKNNWMLRIIYMFEFMVTKYFQFFNSNFLHLLLEQNTSMYVFIDYIQPSVKLFACLFQRQDHSKQYYEPLLYCSFSTVIFYVDYIHLPFSLHKTSKNFLVHTSILH